MGTTYSIKVVSPPSSLSKEKVHSEIKQVLKNINQLMSTYDPDSEVSRFNRLNQDSWFPVSKATLDVISESLALGIKTEGALDITVGKLVNLWGFGKDLKTFSMPDPLEIEKLRKASGFQKIKIDVQGKKIKKTVSGIYVDLASIAKGYGVDQVSQRLQKMGIENFLVEIGGEIRTAGYKKREERKPWVVAVEKPISLKRTIYKKLYIRSNALATSGDYRNYFEKDGVKFSHTLDPKTGAPVSHSLASVSVMHPSCMTADGLATALMVMGEKKGYQWAVKNKIAAYFIYRTKSGFKEKVTPRFQPYFKNI